MDFLKMDKDISAWIAANLAFYRRLRGYTQKELANSLGCTTQLISRYENRRCEIPAGVLYSLSIILAVPVEDFFRRPIEIREDHKNLLSARSIGEALTVLTSAEIREAIGALIDRTVELQSGK